MLLPKELKERAIRLRKKGYSIKEISEKINISKSTSSVWLRDVALGTKAQKRLENRRLIGSYRAGITWKKKREKEERKIINKAKEIVKKSDYRSVDFKIYCALLYWCEGTKGDRETVQFINSDPTLIRLFLALLRKSFLLDEKKFRVSLHLHNYHDERKQKFFWSQITMINERQFYKIYWKPNTKKRIKDEYPGCIRVVYHDISVARELRAIYNEFISNFD